MDLLKHADWRVTTNLHANHAPGPEQWVLLPMWFDHYLKGIDQKIPATPPSTFTVSNRQATFAVTPDHPDRLLDTEIYFSYDPNSRTRFWNRAPANRSRLTWSVTLPVHADLPLYVFASCRYSLGRTQRLEHGETSTFSINSREQCYLPEVVHLAALTRLTTASDVVSDFRNGTFDWHSRDGKSITTHKFQDPSIDRSNSKRLVLTINPHGKPLTLRVQTNSKFLHRPDNQGTFTATKQMNGNASHDVVFRREDFTGPDGKTLEWAKIETLQVTLIDRDAKSPISLAHESGQLFIQTIKLAP